jgi:Gpi18-like mannosyltransferase
MFKIHPLLASQRKHPGLDMHTFKTALKEAAWVFIFSRLTILLVSYITITIIPQSGHDKPVFMWYHWDFAVYVRIAYQGYANTLYVGFFPLWPSLIHFGGLLLGGYFPLSYYLAGLLLANIFFYFALVLLYCLLSEDFEPSLAKRTLFYLAFYPYAIFFFVGYTESLFVLLCVAVFLLLRRGKLLDWWLAGGLGALATLTRSTGIMLIIPFLVMYIRHFWIAGQRNQHRWLQKINALAPIVLMPAASLAYMIYLAYTKSNPFIIQIEEATYWHRHFTWIWVTYGRTITVLYTYPRFALDVGKNLLDIVFTTLPIAVLVLGWKRLPLHYSLFALAAIIFSISFPLWTVNPMASMPRYMMAIFPLIVVLALWGKRRRFDQLFIALGPPLLALNTVLFVSRLWVA